MEILPGRVVFQRAGQERKFALDYRAAPKRKPPIRKRQRPTEQERRPRQIKFDRSKPNGTDDDD